MKLRQLATAIVIGAGIGTPLRAQAPGELNKISHDSRKTAKQAGRARKKVHHGAIHAHGVLTKASKNTKTELKRATHVTTKRHSSKHKARGASKLAHKVSQAGKETGAEAKHGLKQTSSEAHAGLTKAGKDSKEPIKKP
jgi:hypothetical protein